MTQSARNDLVQRQKDRALPPDERLVIEGPELNQLREGTLVSDGQHFDVTPAANRPGGENAFRWHPDDFELPIGDVKLRYSDEAWRTFKDFAKRTEIAPGTTFWNLLLSRSAEANRAQRERQTQMPITRIAERTGNAILGGRHEDAIRTLARTQFARRTTAPLEIRPRDDGTQDPRRAAQVARAFRPQWSVEITAVASGRKPLFHEDLSYLNPADLERAASRLQQQVPAGIEVAARDGHLYVYNPGWLTQFTGGAPPTLAQVVSRHDPRIVHWYSDHGGGIGILAVRFHSHRRNLCVTTGFTEQHLSPTFAGSAPLKTESQSRNAGCPPDHADAGSGCGRIPAAPAQ